MTAIIIIYLSFTLIAWFNLKINLKMKKKLYNKNWIIFVRLHKLLENKINHLRLYLRQVIISSIFILFLLLYFLEDYLAIIKLYDRFNRQKRISETLCCHIYYRSKDFTNDDLICGVKTVHMANISKRFNKKSKKKT